MAFKPFAAVVVALTLIPLAACSKTQDDAPETRIFGSPPNIESVIPVPSTAQATCDVTSGIEARPLFCQSGAELDGSVLLHIDYTQVFFDALVTDPESTEDQSDILLVSASFVTGDNPPIEQTLVLIDDGSEIEFNFNESNVIVDLGVCSLAPPVCSCTDGQFKVTSGDDVKDDDHFKRGFAFLSMDTASTLSSVAGDCIAKANRQAAFVNADLKGERVDFRIEAVDRAGNIAEYPDRTETVIGPTTFSCEGDECACCYLFTSQTPEADVADGGCFGLPGMLPRPGSAIESRCPDGFCRSIDTATNSRCLAL